ncbi:MAG: hypothetical protein HY865_00890 [Chloroflexi bacterium]|nr:hypothetical protein [Chloroflexota bacterium]
MKRAAVIIALAFFLWSCAPDPRREAEAFATRQQAETEAARAEQERMQDAEAHQIFMTRLNETSAWLSRTMVTAMAAGMFVIAVAGLSLGIGLAMVIIGGGYGIAKRNIVMPNRIPLDPITRQYPLLPVYMGNGKYSLTNPNTGATLMLDTKSAPDALMVKAAFGVQHDGLLVSRMSHRPEQTPTQAIEVTS